MKESLSPRAFGVVYAALVAMLGTLFVADKKAEYNLHVANGDIKDALAIRETINESVRNAFSTVTDSDGKITIVDNSLAQKIYGDCLKDECVLPSAGVEVAESDSWATIARTSLYNEIASGEIREQASIFHACTVDQMNCVHNGVLPLAK